MKILTIFSLTALTLSHLTHAKCTCEVQNKNQNSQEALTYKLAAIASILMSSSFGVCLPFCLKNVPTFQPNSPIHFCIKAFAAGVILATGFLHILPDAFESLTSPCISKNPWGSFPFAGLVAMSAAIATLSMEAFATGFHKRAALAKAQPVDVNVDDDDDGDDEESSTSHVHGQAIMLERSNSSDLLRHRVVSQVLELGILVHSVIIGISLGATQSLKTIKPLTIALSFHQFFEGIGLGGCICQAKYKVRAITIMVLFFSLTTPTGIAIGISISNVYHDHSSKALVVEGILNSASAGILIYMALVDLLAADFMNTKLQTNLKLQLGTHFALLMGACSMGILARYGGS